MRFTNFGEKQSFEKESFKRKLKTPNLEKESFVGKVSNGKCFTKFGKKKSFEKESLKFREKRGKFGF